MKKILIIVVFVIVGGVIGYQVRSISSRTRWKRLEYFPFTVESLIAVKPFGNEIWVNTAENEIYKLTYPCLEGQICWSISDDAPTLAEGEFVDHGIFENINYYVVEGECERYHDLVGEFHGEIKTCITSVALAESFYVVSLVLTENNELWIWDRPWVSPYTSMENVISSLCAGGLIGLSLGVFIAFRNDLV